VVEQELAGDVPLRGEKQLDRRPNLRPETFSLRTVAPLVAPCGTGDRTMNQPLLGFTRASKSFSSPVWLSMVSRCSGVPGTTVSCEPVARGTAWGSPSASRCTGPIGWRGKRLVSPPRAQFSPNRAPG